MYSPLNGTGLKPVTRTLKEMGYTNITVVKEQERPDGNFPTCPYPNPEIKEAMALGMEYAKKCNADLLLATDPDCDRVGIAVKNKAGEYELLTGNQTGMLLLDYICSQRVKHNIKDNEQFNSPVRNISFASGCLMLIPIGAVLKVGLLEEKYFLYSEDTDCQCVFVMGGCEQPHP